MKNGRTLFFKAFKTCWNLSDKETMQEAYFDLKKSVAEFIWSSMESCGKFTLE